MMVMYSVIGFIRCAGSFVCRHSGIMYDPTGSALGLTATVAIVAI